jgi:hypothetical protein
MKQNNKHNDGNDEDIAKFIAEMNDILVRESAADFLPEIANITRLEAVTLVEFTHQGLLSPSYTAYGFILLKALCKDEKQLASLYASGARLIESSGLLSKECIQMHNEEAEKLLEKMIIEINIKASKLKNKTNKNNKNKNN